MAAILTRYMYGECNQLARNLGYASAEAWLDLVAGEAAQGQVDPNRLVEYGQIFWSGRAITRYESQLLDALEFPGDWDTLRNLGALTGDTLTREATDTIYRALDALERL